jgi:hypothetical protein
MKIICPQSTQREREIERGREREK